MLGCSYGSVFDCRRGNTSESDTSSDIARPSRKKPRKTTLRSTFQRYIILRSVVDPKYLFWVVFVGGNISRCQGCSGKIMRDSNGKPLPPPNDLVMQHKEQVLFNNPKTGVFQLSSEHRNVYYHARLSCVKQKFPSFIPGQHCRASRDTCSRFSQVHKEYLLKEFGVKFLE